MGIDTKRHYTKAVLENLILDTFKNDMLIDPEHASDEAYYEALCRVTRGILSEKYKFFDAHNNARARKKVYYMSMEFLMGRSLKNSLYNLGIQDAMTAALDSLGVDIERMYALEPDAGLGNGGLGRLAACYLDAMATNELPAIPSCMNTVSSSSASSTAGRRKRPTTGCRAAASG